MRALYHEQIVTLADIEKSARRAERLGFDGYSAPEFRSDPMLQLVLASRATRRMELETRILLAYPRSPMVVAHQSWSLQQFCGGRFRLGLGTSAKPLIQGRFAATWHPAAIGLRDYIQALRSIWVAWEAGRHPDYAGNFYKISTKNDEFRPAPTGMAMPKIGIAATGPIMCRLAGEVANTMMLPILNSPLFFRQRSLPAMLEGAGAAGRNLKDIPVSCTAMVFGAKNKRSLAEAMARARRTIAFYICYSDIYASVMDVHGWSEKHADLRNRARNGVSVDALTAEISDEIVNAFSVVALAEEIGARLKKRYDGIVNDVVFAIRPVGLSSRDQHRALAAAVEELHRT